MQKILLALALGVIASLPLSAQAARLKDIARLDGVRDNNLLGYGVVVGLRGTGDLDPRGVAPQSVRSLLSKLGLRVNERDLYMRNVAAVLVTARLPAFAHPGDRIDVDVASLGDARSLAGGTLIATPLAAADGNTYAVAQGAIVVGGYDARFMYAQRSKNFTTSGRIASGGLVERSAPTVLGREGTLRYVLRRADFTTARRVASAIAELLDAHPQLKLQPSAPTSAASPSPTTEHTGPTLSSEAGTPSWSHLVVAEDASSIRIDLPAELRGHDVELLAAIEGAWIQVDQIARVVVSERTGTVVLGGAVRIAPVAVAHGGLEIEVDQTPLVSQPNALAAGSTVVTTSTEAQVREHKGQLQVLAQAEQGASVADLAAALNALGAQPRDLVVILQMLAAAGALHAEIEVQ